MTLTCWHCAYVESVGVGTCPRHRAAHARRARQNDDIMKRAIDDAYARLAAVIHAEGITYFDRGDHDPGDEDRS